jgi:hypothetical protein
VGEFSPASQDPQARWLREKSRRGGSSGGRATRANRALSRGESRGGRAVPANRGRAVTGRGAAQALRSSTETVHEANVRLNEQFPWLRCAWPA